MEAHEESKKGGIGEGIEGIEGGREDGRARWGHVEDYGRCGERSGESVEKDREEDGKTTYMDLMACPSSKPSCS